MEPEPDEIREGDWVEYSPSAPYLIEGCWRVAAVVTIDEGTRYATLHDGGPGHMLRHLRRCAGPTGETTK